MAAYPETAVLSAFTHGAVTVDKSGRFDVFQIPYGMTVVKVSAVAIGTCNLLISKDGMAMNDELMKNFSDPNMSLADAQAQVEKVTPYVRDIVSTVALGRARKLLAETPDDEDVKEYIRHPDLGFSKVVYTEGQPMIDKIYGRRIEETQGKRKYRYDYRINVLNVPDIPDVFAQIVGEEAPDTMTQLRLSTVLQWLEARGVKNVVLFDFSCALVPEVGSRDVRALRRDAAKYNLNGGRWKTKTSSRKRRRHNGRHQTRSRKVPRHQ
jgi:hypothetical protein